MIDIRDMQSVADAYRTEDASIVKPKETIGKKDLEYFLRLIGLEPKK